MAASKTEQVLAAVKTLLESVPGATVERNSVLPEKIPDGGLIILRDGDPGEPEQALGGFGNTYYQHAVEIEVYVDEGDAAARDAAFDTLLQEIGTALEGNPTLGGLAFGLTYGRPDLAAEDVWEQVSVELTLAGTAATIKLTLAATHVSGGSQASIAFDAAELRVPYKIERPLSVRVYQISAVVGRGHPGSAVV